MSAVGASPAVGNDGSDASSPGAVLAFDVGGTKLAVGVVDGSGVVHSFLVEPTHAARGPEQGLRRLLELGRRAVAESGSGWPDIGAVGICAGGPLDAARGVLVAPVHMPGWNNVEITAVVEREYERPAFLENDATAAALGEHRYGAGAGTRHMVYLTVSTGVGGGVVVDGRLYRGAGGNGSELGHVTVDCAGRLCHGCGRKGCLEAYVSGTSIAERGREAGLAVSSAEDVAAAARAGEPVALQVWDATVDALACGLTSIVNVFEPELVVVGGGVMRAGEQLLGPVRERVRAEAITPAGRAVSVVPSALGDRVGVVGAAAIAYEQLASGLPLAHG